MNFSTKRTIVGAVLVLAVLALFFIVRPADDSKDDESTRSSTTALVTGGTGASSSEPEKPAKPTPPPIPQVIVKNGEPRDGVVDFELRPGGYDPIHGQVRCRGRGPRSWLRREQGSIRRWHREVLFPGRDHRRVRGRARTVGGSDREPPSQPLTDDPLRPRTSVPRRPADSGMAVRLGRGDRPRGLVLRALRRLAGAEVRRATVASDRSSTLRHSSFMAFRGSLRDDRYVPARHGHLCRAERHRGAGSELRADVRLRDRMARLPGRQRPARGRVPGFLAMAVRGQAGRRVGEALSAPTGAASRLSRKAGSLARRGRSRGLRLAGDHLRIDRGIGHALTRGGRAGHGGLLDLHVRDDGALRGRAMELEGRVLLGLLQHVLRTLDLRGAGSKARPARRVLGGDQLGRDPRVAGGGRLGDRSHHVRRRPGGSVEEPDRMAAGQIQRSRVRDHRSRPRGRHRVPPSVDRSGRRDLPGGSQGNASSSRRTIRSRLCAGASPTP